MKLYFKATFVPHCSSDKEIKTSSVMWNSFYFFLLAPSLSRSLIILDLLSFFCLVKMMHSLNFYEKKSVNIISTKIMLHLFVRE